VQLDGRIIYLRLFYLTEQDGIKDRGGKRERERERSPSID
jgi:hypothetical protein